MVKSMVKSKRAKGANRDENPKPMKAAKFVANDNDNYLTNLAIMLGPSKRPMLYEIHLLVLGLGPAMRGYDKLDVALPWESNQITEYHVEMVENEWRLPTYNIRTGARQAHYRKAIEDAYKTWLAKRDSTKNINTIYVDVKAKARVEWYVVQGYLASVLQFFRDVWIINSQLTKEDAYKLAMQLLKQHIKNGSNRRQFFPRYIREKREQLAHNSLDGINDLIKDNTFENPEAVCNDIRVILAHLGRSVKGKDIDVFNRLQKWYTSIPMAQKGLIKRFEWLDPEGDLILYPKPVTQPAKPANKEPTQPAKPANKESITNKESTELTNKEFPEDQVNTESMLGDSMEIRGGAQILSQMTKKPANKEQPAKKELKKALTQAQAPAPAPANVLFEIIDLTVDDMKDFEAKMEEKAKNIVNRALTEGADGGPRLHKANGRTTIKYEGMNTGWVSVKMWEFTQIQALVNVLTTIYEVKASAPSVPQQLKRVVSCATKLGFFRDNEVPPNKDYIAAHVKVWLPLLQRPLFIPYMSMLEGILSPSVLSEKDLTQHFKIAKSALVNGSSFSPMAVTTLLEVIKKVAGGNKKVNK